MNNKSNNKTNHKPGKKIRKEIVINYTKREVRIAIIEDNELVEFLVEREDSRRTVGGIYLGRINAVIPGIQAAFVDIGQDKAAFLHVSDVATGSIDPDDLEEEDIDISARRRRREYPPIETLLKKGQEIMVQIRKEAIGTKGPRISSQLSLPGRFAVLMPNLDHIGISKKIENRKERYRLRNLVRKYRPKGSAVIVRTAGEGVSSEQIRDDIKYLEKRWKDIQKKSEKAIPPTLIHEDVDITVFALRDLFTEDVDQITVDNKDEHERLQSYLKSFAPHLSSRVVLYRDKTPIFDYYEIEEDIEKTLESKIWVRKGGYIVIEHTEALVSIDVNTGRFTGKKNQEDTILETNLIAAREIARQLRLRDIGGIIVVDFIDMEREENRRKVYNEFRNMLKKDRSRARISPISDLGLIEVSRKRVRPSLLHFYSDECPYCMGSGKILSIESMAMKVEQWIRRIGSQKRINGMQFRVNPLLGIFLREDREENIRELAGTYKIIVEIIDDPRMHREDIKILSLDGNRDLMAEFV
ncbi:MAG: Rne/Rng family ribonuclease [Candidatus Krumholzibacteriota bacterium]|nr:Rne/Rng family ribonuclease [Candidatus Krumholzibacteriota bacterium]